MENIELTLLEEEQVKEGLKQLEVLKKYGTRAKITDLGIITGGYESFTHINLNMLFDISSYEEISLNPKFNKKFRDALDERTGAYWTKTNYDKNTVYSVKVNGYLTKKKCNALTSAIRPVLISPSIFEYANSKKIVGSDGVGRVNFGHYSQFAPDSVLQNELEKSFQENKLTKLGETYTFNMVPSYDYEVRNMMFGEDRKCALELVPHTKYKYKNGVYIRVIANPVSESDKKTYLSNGNYYYPKDAVWIKDEPVKWLVDEKAKCLVAEYALLSGFRFSTLSDYNGDFNKSEMKKFLDNYMLKEILQGIKLQEIERKYKKLIEEKEKLKMANPTPNMEDLYEMVGNQYTMKFIN